MNHFASLLVAERIDRYLREAEAERLVAGARLAARATAAAAPPSAGARRFLALRIDAAGRLARRAASRLDPTLNDVVRTGTASSREMIRS